MIYDDSQRYVSWDAPLTASRYQPVHPLPMYTPQNEAGWDVNPWEQIWLEDALLEQAINDSLRPDALSLPDVDVLPRHKPQQKPAPNTNNLGTGPLPNRDARLTLKASNKPAQNSDKPQLSSSPLPKKLGLSGQSHAITPPANSFVVAAPFASFEQSQAFLAKQGLEVLAIMGTGPTGEAPPHLQHSPFAGEGKVQAGYHYLNPGRLTGKTDAPVVKNHTLLQQDFSATSGTITRTDGKTFKLDMTDLAGLDPKARIKARNARLAKLEQDPDVVAITLDAWPAGQVSGEGRDTIPNNRSFRVFDPAGQFIGHVTTPALSLDEAEMVARQRFGDRFGSMDNLDGNVYAKAWVAGSDQPGSTELAKELKFGVLLVRPTHQAKVVQVDSLQDQQARKKALDKEQQQDRLRRLWEYAKRGEFAPIWDKISSSR
jgi:hypothetical protein